LHPLESAALSRRTPTSAIPKYARIGAGVWKADIEGGQKQTNVAPP
jgi:hypothetical protein